MLRVEQLNPIIEGLKQSGNMDNVIRLLKDVKIPVFYKVQYNLCKDEIGDIEKAVLNTLGRHQLLKRINKGESVAITAGSREINNIDLILKVLIDILVEQGAKPFIIPAMGSHGGATAEGQRRVLEGFGITEEKMGVSICATMETVQISKTSNGIPIFVDKVALSADHIIPVGRIKPHTDFKGPFESGLMKMLAIGLGKQCGANICHKLGMSNMSKNVQIIGTEIIKRCSIPFGLGIIENAFHGTWKIEAIPAERIEIEEPILLEEAKKLVPILPFEKVDIIIVQEMGKDISGTGMDSNVIGRSASLGVSRPFAERIGVFALTEKSHGNANGMGLSDAITNGFYDDIKFDQTYPNAITSAETTAVKMPAFMPNDELCVKFLIKTCTGSGKKGVRIVWIKNTLALDKFYISEGLEEDVIAPNLELLKNKYHAVFNETGLYLGFYETEK